MGERDRLVERLRTVEQLKVGDRPPAWMGGPNSWGTPLSILCGEAADKIEGLYVCMVLLVFVLLASFAVNVTLALRLVLG